MHQKSKTGHQIKALILKNLHLQKRQPCTNCCQILTPIICLILTILIRNVAIANISTSNDTIYAEFPLLAMKFNDNTLFELAADFVYRTLPQSYLFDVANPADRHFVGMHDGRHLENYSGMLGIIPNTFYGYVPYNNSLDFDPFPYRVPPQFLPSNTSIDDELFKRYEYLNDDTFDSLRHSSSAEMLPDGAIHFKVANHSRLEAVLRVKDVR
jgi:hypothetical protein